MILVAAACTYSYAAPPPTVLLRPHSSSNRLAFGSCNAQFGILTGERIEQPLWPTIAARSPAAFVWLGDVVYSDRPSFSWDRLRSGRKPMVFTDVEMPGNAMNSKREQLDAIYALQKAEPGYNMFREAVPIFGIYDDHDYGTNDGDATFKHRSAGARAFLDFIDEPADSSRRSNSYAARGGIYTSHVFEINDVTVLLVLLDVRFARTPYVRANKRNDEQQTGGILGKKQWAWLRALLTPTALRRKNVDVVLVGSGTQILPTDRSAAENWERYAAMGRRLELLALLRASGVAHILLSGDVHFGELSSTVVHCAFREREGASKGSEVVELTTSGMTHSWLRHDTLIGASSWQGKLAGVVMARAFAVHARWWPSPERESHYGGLNFGEIEFHSPSPANGHASATIRLLDRFGAVQIERNVSLAPPTTCKSGGESVVATPSTPRSFWEGAPKKIIVVLMAIDFAWPVLIAIGAVVWVARKRRRGKSPQT